MNNKKLHRHLEKLRREMAALEKKDELIAERINRLITDVEHHLKHPSDAAHRANLLKTLNGFIGQFEAGHPRMTNVLNQIMTALSKIGI